MIEQQYYIRERDGHETVAKSPGLKLEFIKDYLHPLGNYNIPNEVQPYFIIMPVVTGELIIGQAVYQKKFFMHSYILSTNEKHRYVKEPEKVFGITKFETDYDITLGSEIPTLAAISYDANSVLFRDRALLFNTLKMDELLFEKLLAAIFTAIHLNRNILIVLDVSTSELINYAKALLYHIYASLPWSVAEELSVSICAPSDPSKNNRHITFLEKGVLDDNEEVMTGFVLDFVNERFLNLDETIHLEPYFKVAASFKSIKPLWEKFNSYGEQLQTAMREKAEKTLGFYSRVATLIALYAHLSNHKLYILEEERERKGFLIEVLGYLNLPISDDFRRELIGIIDYAIKGLEVSLRCGVLLDEQEIDAILRFKLGMNEVNKSAFKELLHLLIEVIEVARRENNEAYISIILDKVSHETALYQNLFKELYTYKEMREEVAYPYIKRCFEEIQTIDDFIERVDQLASIEGVLLSDVYYANLAKTRFMECLQKSSDKVRLLESVQKWCSKHQGQLYEELSSLAEEHFLKHMRLENIESEADLCSILFMHTYEDETYEAIKGYQKLKTSLEAMSPKYIKVNPNVQKQIQYYYKQEVKKQDFYMLVYAFLEPKIDGNPEEGWLLNLTKVLTYLYFINPDIMLDFIIWSKGQEVYMDKTHFDTIVVDFFIALKQREGKWPKALTKQKLEAQSKTKDLYSKINRAMQLVFVRKYTIFKL